MTSSPDPSPDRAPGDHPLNPEQRAAIEHGEGPLMVLAGAGTGKTRVLVHRIARLVQTGTSPWAILAVTFTNKAADEMCHRLRALLGDAAEAMWIGTFHAICARVLRRFGTHVGLTRGFAIFDEGDQVKILERLLEDTGLGENVSSRVVLSRIDRAKNRGVVPSSLSTEPGSIDDVVARIYPLYQERLARENAVDFNDLILRTIQLFGIGQTYRVLSSKFRHVLVDEFQDTNAVQYGLVCRFAESRNLTVVGDDDQSIYAWRGAEPKNLLNFDQDFPDARVIKLERNYRSTQAILDAANQVIAHNVARHGKALWTDQGRGPAVESHQANDERSEAYFVAEEIRALLAAHPRPASDVAVLYRTNAQSRVLEEYLHAAGIPARVVGGVSFFERKEIRDVVAYLRLIVNPLADAALERVINVPARGIGEKTLERIRIVAKSNGGGLLAAARVVGAGSSAAGVGPAARKKLQAFCEMFDGICTMSSMIGISVAETVVQVIERSGLRAHLEEDKSAEASGRLDNLAELVTMAIDFADEVAARASRAAIARAAAPASGSVAQPIVDPLDDARDRDAPTLDGFLERIVLASPADKKPGEDAVVLTTIHVAKGLEWPIVFVTGMEDGLFPSLRAREEVSEEDALEEERRLAYVAITRARERLVMSHARSRRIWGEVRIQEPSRFLDEALGRDDR